MPQGPSLIAAIFLIAWEFILTPNKVVLISCWQNLNKSLFNVELGRAQIISVYLRVLKKSYLQSNNLAYKDAMCLHLTSAYSFCDKEQPHLEIWYSSGHHISESCFKSWFTQEGRHYFLCTVVCLLNNEWVVLFTHYIWIYFKRSISFIGECRM